MLQKLPRSLLILFLLIALSPIRAEKVIARSSAGAVTDAELILHSAISNSPYKDPLRSYCSETTEAARKDAEQFVVDGIDQVLWERQIAKEACDNRFSLNDQETSTVKRSTESCMIDSYEQHLLDDVVSSSVSVLESTFRKHQPQLRRPESRRIWYLFQGVGQTSTSAEKQAVRDRLESVRTAILSGKLEYATAAREYSEAPSAATGGDIGFITASQKLNPRVQSYFFSLQPEQLSKVTELHNGFYLAAVLELSPAVNPTVSDLQSSEPLRSQVRQLALQDCITSLVVQTHADNPRRAIMETIVSEHFRSPQCETFATVLVNYLLAHGYFRESHERDLAPTETEISDYYRNHENEMKGEGIWQLTRFTWPVAVNLGEQGAFRNGHDALAVARACRSQILQTSGSADLAAQRFGAQVSSSSAWQTGSGDGETDRELAKLEVGALSSPRMDSKGAFFYRLDAKRPLPTLPLEQRRDYIITIMQHLKFMKIVEQDRARLISKLNVVHSWRENPCAK